MRSSSTTFPFSPFWSPSRFLQSTFLYLISLPSFHLFIRQEFFSLIPISIWPTLWRSLTMMILSRSNCLCPMMWAKRSPSSLLTSASIATRRLSGVLKSSKAPAFLYTTFASANGKSYRSPCTSRGTTTDLKSWLFSYRLMSAQWVPRQTVYSIQNTVERSWMKISIWLF